MNFDVSKPDRGLRGAFLAMLDDYDAHDPENGKFYAAARADFGTYVQRLHDDERGLDLPEGYVPCSHRWLIDQAAEIVGIVRVRHTIGTPFLAEEAGHIGYDVPPARRGRRYGVASLRAGLAEARRLGLTRVLLCADADNPPSWRTIETCGGVLEREFHSEFFSCVVRRYWVELTEPEADDAPADAASEGSRWPHSPRRSPSAWPDRSEGMDSLNDRHRAVGRHYDDDAFEYELTRLERHSPVERAMTERYLERFVSPGSIVADVGVGAGHYDEFLARRGCSL